MFNLRRLGLSLALLPTLTACPGEAPGRPARTRQPANAPTTTTTAATPASAAATGPVELRGATSAHPWHVSIVVDDQAARTRALTLAPALQAIVAEVERQLAPGRVDGELGRFNRARSRQPMPVTGPALAVVEAALALGVRTDGAFDITAGPVRAAWADVAAPPDKNTLESARGRTGLQRVRPVKGMLKKDTVDLEVDASPLVDSVAVDGIAAALRERGFNAFVIEVGGAAAIVGRAPDGPRSVSLPVGAEKPLAVIAAPVDAPSTRAVAAATAPGPPGTIDPRSARPVTHDLTACVVVGEDVVVVDGLAEACLVLGPEALPKVLRAFPGVEASWQRADGSSSSTPGFPR
jgi:thiamine biosynthesis lipoprotein